MSGEIEQEANALSRKEHWIQNAADIVSKATGIDSETAVGGASWASLWLDDLKQLAPEELPTSRKEVKELLKTARKSSLERCEVLERYPTGAPTLKSIAAAHEAFCLAYGEQAGTMMGLLEGIEG